MGQRKKVGIIGAGVAGMATAVRMAIRGYQVEVFEASANPGGKLNQFSLGEYRFDLGPSLFTMPHYVDELFHLAGENPRDHFNYYRLAEVCRYFWEDKTVLQAFADIDAFANEAHRQLGVAPEVTKKMMASAARKYHLTGTTFLEKSLHKVATWTNWSVLRSMLLIPTLDLFSTMHRVHKRKLKNDKFTQLFDRFATYNGSNPYKAPGLLSMIPHFEHHFGAYLPVDGMYGITQAIFKLAKRLGVQFHFNQRVERILVSNGQVKGLKVAKQELSFDTIISNQDVFFTYRQLIPDQKPPERILRQQKSSSALIFYWGIRDTFPKLNVHNIFFSQDYQAEFAALEKGTMFEDPTVYINQTARYVAGDAPSNAENWFVMINAPFEKGQDWPVLLQQTRQRVLTKLSRILGRDIEGLIEEETILDPPAIQAKTGSHLGALYGTSSNNKMAAFMRHPNFSHRIKDLYFCGGSVHPGGGIPLCMLSAKIIDELLHGIDHPSSYLPDPVAFID